MITHYFRTVKDDAIKTVDRARTGVWTHVVAPTVEELQQLVRDCSLDDSILEDATDFYEVPRLERSGGATYLFTRYPSDQVHDDVNTAPLLIVMTDSAVITVAQYEVVQFGALVTGELPVYTTQKAKLFLQLMDVLTESFDAELLKLRKRVYKDRVRLRSIGTREIERLVSYETKLNSMVDALVPTNRALQQVLTGSYIQLYADDREIVEDVMIANEQVVNSARSVLKTIQNIRGAIEAIMSSRLNNALRILTVITILLTVPLVFASLYGMNVPLPLQDSPYTFALIVLINVAMMGVLAVVFRKNQWF